MTTTYYIHNCDNAQGPESIESIEQRLRRNREGIETIRAMRAAETNPRKKQILDSLLGEAECT
jgi:hypothetical protein